MLFDFFETFNMGSTDHCRRCDVPLTGGMNYPFCGVCSRVPVVGPELSADPMVRARDAMSRSAGLFVTVNFATGHRVVTEGRRVFRDIINIPLMCVIHAAQTEQLFPYGGDVPTALVPTPALRPTSAEGWTMSLLSTLLLMGEDLEEPEE